MQNSLLITPLDKKKYQTANRARVSEQRIDLMSKRRQKKSRLIFSDQCRAAVGLFLNRKCSASLFSSSVDGENHFQSDRTLSQLNRRASAIYRRRKGQSGSRAVQIWLIITSSSILASSFQSGLWIVNQVSVISTTCSRLEPLIKFKKEEEI